MPNKKLNIVVIFGGRSSEHEVSLVSAQSVIANLDKTKYNIIPVGIAKTGEWLVGSKAMKTLVAGTKLPKNLKARLAPDPTAKSLLPVASKNKLSTEIKNVFNKTIDVVFPVMHGTYGEDGTIQGLFELANIPYVGCGVVGSATAMDKIIQKQICADAEILMAEWIWLTKKEWSWIKKSKKFLPKWLKETEDRLGYPMFVKPANAGSSIGISKVHNRKELIKAVDEAVKYDRRVVVEQGIEKAMEIEVSILGNEEVKASVPGQIISSNEFYDYNAKYVDSKSKAIIPAPLPEDVTLEIQNIAIQTYKLLDCAGMARVDFFVNKTGRTWNIYLSELNTIPGFTSISMYPKLWEATGLKYGQLLDILIKLALERHQEKSNLQTTIKLKQAWHKNS